MQDGKVFITFNLPDRNVHPQWTLRVKVLSLKMKHGRVSYDIRYGVDLPDTHEINLKLEDCVRQLLTVPDVDRIELVERHSVATIYFKLECRIASDKPLKSPEEDLKLCTSLALHDFQRLLNDSNTSDVEIKVLRPPGKSFHCHKSILSARSPIFRAMFLTAMKETTENLVEVADIPSTAMDHFLNFIYSGGFQDDSWLSSLPQLVYAADKYCVTSLKELCDSHLIRSVNCDNALSIAKLAVRHDLTKAESDIRNFIAQHADELTLDDV